MKFDDEKSREQLLKRILPTLVILVFYFVFIKGAVNKELKVAEQQFTAMSSKGISEQVLPELHKRKAEIARNVAVLQSEYGKVQQQLSEHTKYLEGSGNVNQTLETLSSYFADNRLHVTQENWVEPSGAATLPKSFNAVKLWLIASKKKKNSKPSKRINGEAKEDAPQNRLREIQFYGSYQNTYEAMLGFANRNFNVIPVSISMSLPEDSSAAANSGVLKWALKLWM